MLNLIGGKTRISDQFFYGDQSFLPTNNFLRLNSTSTNSCPRNFYPIFFSNLKKETLEKMNKICRVVVLLKVYWKYKDCSDADEVQKYKIRRSAKLSREKVTNFLSDDQYFSPNKIKPNFFPDKVGSN